MSNSAVGTVIVTVSEHQVCVRIKNVPHLLLSRSDLVSIRSWRMSVGCAVPYYMIEIVLRGHEVTCEYDNRELWEEILTKIDEACVFDHRLGEKS